MRRNQVRAGWRGRTHDLVILCMVCILHCIVQGIPQLGIHSTHCTPQSPAWLVIFCMVCILHCIPELGMHSTLLGWLSSARCAQYTAQYNAYPSLVCIVHCIPQLGWLYFAWYSTLHSTLHTPACFVYICMVCIVYCILTWLYSAQYAIQCIVPKASTALHTITADA